MLVHLHNESGVHALRQEATAFLKVVFLKICDCVGCLQIGSHIIIRGLSINAYCTLRGRDQRLKCAIISIFYGAVLYLPNFRKIQHT